MPVAGVRALTADVLEVEFNPPRRAGQGCPRRFQLARSPVRGNGSADIVSFAASHPCSTAAAPDFLPRGHACASPVGGSTSISAPGSSWIHPQETSAAIPETGYITFRWRSQFTTCTLDADRSGRHMHRLPANLRSRPCILLTRRLKSGMNFRGSSTQFATTEVVATLKNGGASPFARTTRSGSLFGTVCYRVARRPVCSCVRRQRRA